MAGDAECSKILGTDVGFDTVDMMCVQERPGGMAPDLAIAARPIGSLAERPRGEIPFGRILVRRRNGVRHDGCATVRRGWIGVEEFVYHKSLYDRLLLCTLRRCVAVVVELRETQPAWYQWNRNVCHWTISAEHDHYEEAISPCRIRMAGCMHLMHECLKRVAPNEVERFVGVQVLLEGDPLASVQDCPPTGIHE